MLVTSQEVVDLRNLLAIDYLAQNNETTLDDALSKVGQVKHATITQHNDKRFFVVADSFGYITIVGKVARKRPAKSYVGSTEILQIQKAAN